MSRKTKTTATKEEAEPALVPKLRFPDFQDSDDWQTKLLGDLCKIRTGKKDANEGASDGQYPFFTCAENHIFSHSYSFDAEAILIAGNANVGQTRYYHGKFEAYQRTYVLTDFSGISVPYLYAVLNAKLRESLLAHVQVSAMSYIKLPMLQEYALAVPPSSAEQQKIAECLSSADELMAAQARKVDALKTHKKGLMQQLFPREGETTPRLRFPEFQDAGEWVTEPVLKLADYENGKAYEKDIAENGQYVVVNSRFISTDGAVRKYTNADYLIAKAGEVLMVLSDLPKGKALAKCYFVEANDRYAVNQRVCRLKPKRIEGKFLYYVLNRHPRLLAYDDGLNQTHLSKGGVTECPLCVPPQKGEQQRIATCLSSLDALITAETQKLESLKTHKKGLLQQLFPSPEEVEA